MGEMDQIIDDITSAVGETTGVYKLNRMLGMKHWESLKVKI